MDPIIIRYGENVTLPIDVGDVTATSADIYVGKPGQAFILTKNAPLVAGVGKFLLSRDDTKLPIGDYKYQINATDDTGYVEKYPSPESVCDDENSDFPDFIVKVALDETEVS